MVDAKYVVVVTDENDVANAELDAHLIVWEPKQDLEYVRVFEPILELVTTTGGEDSFKLVKVSCFRMINCFLWLRCMAHIEGNSYVDKLANQGQSFLFYLVEFFIVFY
jgi:hypothetical protein